MTQKNDRNLNNNHSNQQQTQEKGRQQPSQSARDAQLKKDQAQKGWSAHNERNSNKKAVVKENSSS